MSSIYDQGQILLSGKCPKCNGESEWNDGGYYECLSELCGEMYPFDVRWISPERELLNCKCVVAEAA